MEKKMKINKCIKINYQVITMTYFSYLISNVKYLPKSFDIITDCSCIDMNKNIPCVKKVLHPPRLTRAAIKIPSVLLMKGIKASKET